jgi:CRP/FNR family transcriptional regulator
LAVGAATFSFNGYPERLADSLIGRYPEGDVFQGCRHPAGVSAATGHKETSVMMSNPAPAVPLSEMEAPAPTGMRTTDLGYQLGQLLAPSRRQRVAARSVLYQEGETARNVFMLRSGLVKLVSHPHSGRARIVRLRGSGGLLGIGGVVHSVYEHTAVAVDDMVVETIPVRRLARLRETSPQLYARIAERWYSELRDADTWIMQFSTGSIRARVARLVNYLSMIRRPEGRGDGFPACVSLLTCGEMAAVLGVTPESVSRVLAEFKRAGLLQTTASGVHECDEPGLRAIAQD